MLNTSTGATSLQGEVAFSAVSRNGGDLELVAYPADELQQQLVNPVREGWTFHKWLDAEGRELLPQNIIEGGHYYAGWVDKVPPSLIVTCTQNTAPYQEVNMQAEDIASDIYGYYIGTENPAETAVEYAENSAKEVTAKIEAADKYYFSVQDTCGNSSTESMEFIFITFVTGEDEETACESILGRVGDTLMLPEAKKKGHSLVGWIEEGKEEETVPVMEHTFVSEVSFEPVFVPNQYQIHLDGNGGNCDIQMVEATFGCNYPELPIASRTGYHFLGWSQEVNGELLQETAMYEVDGDSTLYAKWEPIRYTVRYMGNGSTGGEMESMECTYDVAFAHPRNAYTKDGYVFKGWSTSPGTISTQNALTARDRSYNGAEWLNEDMAVNITAEADTVVNLYAVWQKIEVGVMDYRYCMGQYMYFACTTLNYKTENAEDNGALFVGITPAGGNIRYGADATWATSEIRVNLNDTILNDMTGLQTTNTTVNYSYSGNMWAYDPNKQSPCTLADAGYGTKIVRKELGTKTQTIDYIFIPDLRDCYNYYNGNDWNWFWDMNLDGVPDTYTLTGLEASGPTDSYYTCINNIRNNWATLGWTNRYWLRNQYTGYSKYPFYIAEYSVSACNPSNAEYASFYSNLASNGKYLVRPMYTMKP